MLDKSLTYVPLMMTKTDTKNYPRFDLPEGYSFRFYRAGDEKDWVALECSIGQFDTEEAALRMFRGEFIENQILKPEERMLFVVDPEGKAVASASLWDGILFGERRPRFHWVVVSDACTGKGIAKAMLSRILDLYNELGYEGFIYLNTSTWSYQAIGIYKKLGFVPYLGEKNPFPYISDADFLKNNATAWAAVDEKHNLYKKQ